MTNRRNRHPARRRFLKQAAAITMSRIGPATALAAPVLAFAQTDAERQSADAKGATAGEQPVRPPVGPPKQEPQRGGAKRKR